MDTTRTRSTRRRAAARPGAGIPAELDARLRMLPRERDRFVTIAEHERRGLERSVAQIVGPTNAQDVVSEVIVRHLEAGSGQPDGAYGGVEEYQRLRARLLRSVRNAAIDMTRRRRWADILVGGPGDPALRSALTGADEEPDDQRPISARLDAAALYDALRRLDPRDADVLRVKLVEGRSFAQLASHLGVRSTNAAHKRYVRAARAAQAALVRYGAGGYCAEYAPYLPIVDAGCPDRHLQDAVGRRYADEIRLHVWGAPDIQADDGCHHCQTAARRHRQALSLLLPPPAVLLPGRGPVTAITDWIEAARTGSAAWWTGVVTGAAGPWGAGIRAAALAAAIVGAGGLATLPRPGGSDAVSASGHAFVAPRPASVPAGPAPLRRSNRPRSPVPEAPAAPACVTRCTASAPERRAAARASGSAAREFTPGP